LKEALRDALAYARERIAQNTEISKKQHPTTIGQTPKETKIKQETAIPEEVILLASLYKTLNKAGKLE
jgi:hypothetical protein